MLSRTRAVVLCLLLVVSISCSPRGADGDAILLEVGDDSTITFKVWFKTGSAADPEGKRGLAYLTGQMLAHGATTNNSLEEILARLYPMASSYSVSVDREMTVLTGRTHRDNLAAFYELFTDAYLRPAFADEDFSRLKTETLNYLEKSLRYSQDEELAKAALYDFVFEGTAYAHPPRGTVAGVRSLSVEDVRAFYDSNYTRENAVVALGGGFDDALVRKFRQSLAGLPAAGEEGRPADADVGPVTIEGRQVLLVDKPDADASISFGLPLDVRRGDREFYALWVANSWLGEHRNSSSHLYKVIREKRGLNYGDYSYIEAFPNGGRRSFPPNHVGRNRQLFEVWIRTLPDEQALFALRAAIREVETLVDRGLTEEQFELTRSFLRKYLLHYADTTSRRLGYAVDDRFYGVDGEGHLARFRSVLDELTLDEVNGAVRKHLVPEHLKIAIVTGNAEGLREALATDAASPVTYPTTRTAEVLAEDEVIAKWPLSIAAEAIRVVPLDEMFRD